MKNKSFKLIMAMIMCFVFVFLGFFAPTTVSAKTKYTKEEKRIAKSMCSFAGDKLAYPNSFEICTIKYYKVIPTDYNDNGWYADKGYMNNWLITYKAKNIYGTKKKSTLTLMECIDGYAELSGNLVPTSSDEFKCTSKKKSKSFVKKINKLTKKYIKKEYY